MVNGGFCSSVGFEYELDCSCFRRVVQDIFLDSLEGKREGCLRAGSTQRRPVLPSPAPPRRPAVRRPDPTGPWFVRVLGSTTFDPLEGTRILCFLGEQFCWHPILPDPARPPCRAPRPDPHVVCPGFGFDKCSNTTGDIIALRFDACGAVWVGVV